MHLTQNMKDLFEKCQNLKLFWPCSIIGAYSKIWINDVFYRFIFQNYINSHSMSEATHCGPESILKKFSYFSRKNFPKIAICFRMFLSCLVAKVKLCSADYFCTNFFFFFTWHHICQPVFRSTFQCNPSGVTKSDMFHPKSSILGSSKKHSTLFTHKNLETPNSK